MRKDVVYASIDQNKRSISFYYRGQEEQFLFETAYRKNFYEFFRYGKNRNQLYQHRTWNRDWELRNLIEERLIPRVRKIQKED